MMATRRFFLILLLWAGIAAPAFAVHTVARDALLSSAAAALAYVESACPSIYGSYSYRASSYCQTPSPTVSPSVPGLCAYKQLDSITICRGYVETQCPQGQHFDAAGQCVPDEEPEQQCEDQQTWNSQQSKCIPDTPEPELGKKMPKQGSSAGTCDANGENCQLADWLKNGTTSTTNCGGWTCTVSSSQASDPPNCYVYTSDKTKLFCDFDPVYQGSGPYASGPSPQPGPSGPKDQSLVCPSGYVQQGSICVQSTPPPDPTKLTDPGSKPGPGQATCPVGYTQTSTGGCVSTSPPSGNCPPGYTLAGGVCKIDGGIDPRSGEATSGGTGGSGTGSCGAPGQPVCAVSLSSDGATTVPIQEAGNGNFEQGELGGHASTVIDRIATWGTSDPAKESQQQFYDQWRTVFDTIPMSGCAPFSTVIAGHSWSFDICPTAEKISVIASYAMWIYFLVGAFVLVTTPKGGTA